MVKPREYEVGNSRYQEFDSRTTGNKTVKSRR